MECGGEGDLHAIGLHRGGLEAGVAIEIGVGLPSLLGGEIEVIDPILETSDFDAFIFQDFLEELLHPGSESVGVVQESPQVPILFVGIVLVVRGGFDRSARGVGGEVAGIPASEIVEGGISVSHPVLLDAGAGEGEDEEVHKGGY